MDITSFIIPVVVSIVLTLLYKASLKKSKIDEDGNRILKLPIFYVLLGGLFSVGSLVVLIWGLISCKPDEVIIVCFAFLLMACLGVPLFLIGWFSQVKIIEEGIEQTTMFGKIKFIKWSEIESISFGKMSQELKIKSETQKVKVPMQLVGFNELVDEIELKTDFDRSKIGLPERDK
ncbi:MAG: hypothetical protein HRT71_07385 [Flavobacteriales bacterium]|nr:hypothetical protein [Flavobacteriales bacterium]